VPELPEAETIVRGLRPAVVGSRICSAEILRADVLREPQGRFSNKVRDRTVVAVERRGKNVLLVLDGDRLVAVNLGMTGRLLPFSPRATAEPAGGHPAVRFRLGSGDTLVFDDMRRFGTVECLTDADWSERSARMGPEPLEENFTPDALWSGLRGSRTPVRSWLLDQRKVAGVGNIYANEALFLAGVHPKRLTRRVSQQEASGLHGGLRRVLNDAIAAGGTTLRDYRDASGDAGSYQPSLLVYGRDGEPCTRCSATVRRLVFGGRSAFYCPGCQPGRGGRA
jgi:formamidopyrimidine-DNA glycosylase